MQGKFSDRVDFVDVVKLLQKETERFQRAARDGRRPGGPGPGPGGGGVRVDVRGSQMI